MSEGQVPLNNVSTVMGHYKWNKKRKKIQVKDEIKIEIKMEAKTVSKNKSIEQK
jgi:hypothetical protein